MSPVVGIPGRVVLLCAFGLQPPEFPLAQPVTIKDSIEAVDKNSYGNWPVPGVFRVAE